MKITAVYVFMVIVLSFCSCLAFASNDTIENGKYVDEKGCIREASYSCNEEGECVYFDILVSCPSSVTDTWNKNCKDVMIVGGVNIYRQESAWSNQDSQ